MNHKHHIIPKHMGGTDEPSNLVELTVEEHANAHRILYEQHGLWQDYCAWQALSGTITIEQARRIATSKMVKGTIYITDGTKNKRIKPEDDIPLGWRKGITNKPPGYKEKISKALTGKTGPKRSKEFKENLRTTYSGRSWYINPETGKRTWK
jgi:hypothetical protein